MRMTVRRTLLLVLPLACATAEAQIYRCTSPEGTPIFSDERCGPDAKIVPGISTGRRSSSSSSPSRPKVEQQSAAELQLLLERCNAGDPAACTTWTKGGGPNQLREEEKKNELACEGGSLAACETRYCLDGISAECRRRVLQTAKLSGTSWYLREQQMQQNGATLYAVRCAAEGSRAIRDIAITCAAVAGPQRCSVASSAEKYPRLDQAAHAVCGADSVHGTR